MKRYIKYIITLIVVLIISLGIITTLNLLNKDNTIEEKYISYIEPSTTTSINTNMFYVDLKGAVKKPGVYKVKQGTIVNELIELAGGLTKNAYTDNINLSKKLTEETVIFVYTVSEIKKMNTTTTTTNPVIYDSYIQETTTNISDNTKLVNINTASINELTSLTGIGESKALAIVAYRTKTPFKSIEELKNISGIGDSLYAKIKDNITV
jgi:competence protein ComEA